MFDPAVPSGDWVIDNGGLPIFYDQPFLAGTRLAFYIERWDATATDLTRFYSMPTMNPGGNHVHESSTSWGETIFSWEDLSKTELNPGGLEYDGDFDDVILGVGTLTADNLAPVIWVAASEPSVNENGTQSLTFTFTNMQSDGVNPFEPWAAPWPMIVPFSEGQSTARAGLDYSGIPGNNGVHVLVIPANESSVTVTLTLIDDTLLENDEVIEFYPLTLFEYQNLYGWYGWDGSDSWYTTIFDDDKVDLDIDSDNTGLVDRSPEEELKEEGAGEPGKFVTVGGAREPMVFELKPDVIAQLAITSGANKVRVWNSPVGGEQILSEANPSISTVAIPSNTVWIEAIKPSESAGDIVVTLQGPDGSWDSDAVRMTVAAVDLDVNSDNVGGAELDASEDAIEDIAGLDATPGLYLQVQDEDADGDGLVNWADGFGGLGAEENGIDDETSYGAAFEPIYFNIPDYLYDPFATVEIFYSASVPSSEVMDSHYLSWDRPTDGHLRLWTKDASFPRDRASVKDDGDFVAASTIQAPVLYTLAELNLVPGVNVLFLEAIRESMSVGQQAIKFRFTPQFNGQPAPFTLDDQVRVTTARIEVMADNRDGTSPFPTFGLTATRLPNPHAGLSGLVPEFSQTYTINVYDPRGPEKIHTVYVAGTPLALTSAGTARYTTAQQFLVVPHEDIPLLSADDPVEGLLGGPLHPSDVVDGAAVVPVSGATIEIRYNGETTLGLLKPDAIEVARKFVEEIADQVAVGMKTFASRDLAGNSGRLYELNDSGAFGKEFEARMEERRLAIANDASLPQSRRALASQLRVNISVDANGIVGIAHPNQTGAAQLDFVFVRDGYEPTVGQPLEKRSVIIFEVRTSVTGDLTKEKLAIREALSDYPVGVVNSRYRYKLVNGAYQAVENGRFLAAAMFLRGVGGKVLRVAPYAGAAGAVITNMSSATWAAEQQILNEMVQMGHISRARGGGTDDLRHDFADKVLEWYSNRFSDDDLSKLSIMRNGLAGTPEFDSLIDEWNENLPNMYQSLSQ